MRYKYQLIILGNHHVYSQQIQNLFFENVASLKLSKDAFRIINQENFDINYKQNQPAFCIFFGDNNGSYGDIKFLDKLIFDAVPILPVYFSDFHIETPRLLKHYNGVRYNRTNQNKIINLVLESFGKLRQSRKVFISYKREDASSVAIQLYETLESNNFDVFLDTYSIRAGELFQEELWHRMTDSDVIVMLNTKNFMKSHWCKEEFAEANAKQIGIVQVVWPQQRIENTAAISTPIYLKGNDFLSPNDNNLNSPKLNDIIRNRIVEEVESMRARNLAARQDNLITEFTSLAKSKTMVLQPERYLTEDLTNGKRRIFVPAIGVPQSQDCNRYDELRQRVEDFEIDSIYLIYDDLRIREKWLNHLDWLNKHLEIQTLKKRDFETWLKNN